MNIIQIVQSATLSIDVERPQTLYSNTDRTSLELTNTVNTAALQILDDYDWQRLIRPATIVGDGIQTAFPLPSDYSRMVRDASLIGPNWRFYPAQQLQDYNRWLELMNYPVATWEQRWMVFGGNLNIMPIMPLDTPLSYGYISTSIVIGADPTTFTADTDQFVLDDELLRLGIIWNWKSAKGYDFSSELAQYQQRLEMQRFRDVGSRQTIIGGGRRGRYTMPGAFG
jgi:hypothetical protein